MAGFAFRRRSVLAQANLRPAQAELAALRFQCAIVRLALALKQNFNPDQRRVPTGQSGGGRWTDGSGGGFVRVAASEEDERRPEEEFDQTAEIRDAAFANSYRAIRRLEPGNQALTFVSSGNSPSWNTVNAYQQELEAAQARTSERIANGHAFEAHASEFGVYNRDDFAAIIRQIISSPLPQVRDLIGGRTMYYDAWTNTVVFVQPATRDGGSMFKPIEGQAYVNKQK